MDKEFLVSFADDETRVAILEEGELAEFYVERPLTQRVAENIYKGKVENVLPGMQAAFVNIGLERNAFLYVEDALPQKGGDVADDLPDDARRLSIKDVVKVGQEVIVQVIKEPTGTKGARVTRHLTIPGRYLVLLPAVDYVGVSRRIVDPVERERLKAAAQRIKPPGVGLIVRTVAEGCGEEDLVRDLELVQRLWREIQQRASANPAPCLLHRDMGIVYRLFRDALTRDVRRIRVDGPGAAERVREILDLVAPEMAERVEVYRGPLPLLEAYNLDDVPEKALNRRVWLRNGAYLIIDQTEALTAVDVNTGKFVGSSNLAETVFATNLEAAREIARQLRLRDIGGIIVIDFIDMDVPEHRQKVVAALSEALQRDRTKSTVLGITPLGLVEMTRKKGRQSLRDVVSQPCPYCNGRGRILTEETASRKIRREIKRLLRKLEAEAILVETHPSVASLLIGPGGSNLRELERETGRCIFIRGSEQCHVEAMHLRHAGTREEVERLALPVRVGQVVEVQVQEPHVANNGDGIARLEGYVIDVEAGGRHVGQKVKVEIVRTFRTYAKARILDTSGAR
ncbi:MAG: Rne/Rng family ribonuclease [Clostridia bacterium]|nr:Rne/Rng family ribonuclease [Clostridia bacterium]